jgi:hypothetical protein
LRDDTARRDFAFTEAGIDAASEWINECIRKEAEWTQEWYGDAVHVYREVY